MTEYEGHRLIIKNPTCSCNYHRMPDTNIYIGNGIITKSSEYISKHLKGEKCLLVTDDKLFGLFGHKVLDSLKSVFDVSVCIPPSEGELKPDTAALGYIMMEYQPGMDFMIALGSGTINDLVRYASSLLKIPYVSMGTAPSMDGYVSVISPMLKGNLKINNPADYPAVGIYDIDIISSAPPEMIFSGFGDVIGKYIAKADWILSSYITGEHLCPYCIGLSTDAIALVLEKKKEIASGSKDGAKALLEALLLTGLAMLINTDSRPAASNEHNMGHFWEMRKLMEEKPHPSHGEAVGVATLYCLAFYKEMLSLDVSGFDVNKLPEGNYNPSLRENLLLEIYGSKIGRSIIEGNPSEPISYDERQNRIMNFIENIDEIRESLSFLPDYNEMAGVYRELRGPVNAKDISIEKDLLRDALLYAKDYRERYNIFKTADELGILEEMVEKIIDLR